MHRRVSQCLAELGGQTDLDWVSDLANCDIDEYIKGKKTDFAGIGPGSLEKFQRRAVLLTEDQSTPVLTGEVTFPDASTELFFDIEVDPFHDFCYLHGFVVRQNQDSSAEQYISFFADTLNENEEEQIFRQAFDFIQENQPCAIYYYSKYERTIWRKLQEKYPGVCTAEEVEAIFDPSSAIDLYYDVVLSKTEWPTNNYSLKTLASYLGFAWRDTEPSGAASIEWYHRFIDTNDLEVKTRILEYNEDDCRATRVLLDGIHTLIRDNT